MKRPEPAVLRFLAFAGALIGIVLVLILFQDIFQPLLLGLLIAYVFDPIVSSMQRRGRSRELGVAMIALLLVLGAVLLVLVILPTVNAQLHAAAQKMPQYSARLREQFLPMMKGLEEAYPAQASQVRESLFSAIRNNLSTLATLMGTVMGRTFSSLLNFLLFLLDLIFIPVFAFYLLVDFPKIRAGIADLIPVPYRQNTLSRLGEVDEAISSFLRGQLKIAIILATINSIGLMLLGVPLGLVIGIVAGLANMVPYMSLIIGLAPALLLCWAEWGSLGRLLGVMGVFGGAQLLEGMILGPRILSASVNLHPVWVLLAIIAGGNLFGFFGMLLAVPVAAAIQVYARHAVQAYKTSAVYGATEVPALPPPDPTPVPMKAEGRSEPAAVQTFTTPAPPSADSRSERAAAQTFTTAPSPSPGPGTAGPEARDSSASRRRRKNRGR